MTYLRSTWYVAGFSDELATDAMLSRTLLDEPVVFFRDGQGRVNAIADRCPHRFAPLSMGKLCDGVVQCPYHGMRFDGSGTCVHNPHGDGSVPKAAEVKSYAAVERYGLLWWWGGEPSKADAALIPDYSSVTSAPADATIRGYMPTDCHYELLVDNILDLTHADFVHAGGLGSGALTRCKATVVDHDEHSATVAWLSSGDAAPRAFDMHLRQQGQPTDQWTEVTWHAPSNMLLHVGATLQGEPREQGVDSFNLHLATPESATRTHYWYWSMRTFAISPEANAMIRPMIEHAFRDEDKPMLEAQSRNMGGEPFWSLKPVLLPGDVGAVRARRKLAALIEAQS